MPFNDFDFCVICDFIRPEMGGKLMIMGFYGLTPNVEIVLAALNQPLQMSFVAGFPPYTPPVAAGGYQNVITVLRPNGTVIFQTPQTPMNVAPNKRGMIATTFVLTPPHVTGRHTIRVHVNTELKLETSFNLRMATPDEAAQISGIPFVPQGGRPN